MTTDSRNPGEKSASHVKSPQKTAGQPHIQQGQKAHEQKSATGHAGAEKKAGEQHPRGQAPGSQGPKH